MNYLTVKNLLLFFFNFDIIKEIYTWPSWTNRGLELNQSDIKIFNFPVYSDYDSV